jgi:thiol-disulfide isomerase/thioredoxin
MMGSITSKFQDNRNLVIVLVTAVVLGVLGYVIYTYARPKLLTEINRTDEEVESGEAEIMFFFADWCPHCKKAKPHWEEVKKTYDGKNVNGHILTFTDVDCSKETDETKEITSQYNVEGYPTIKLIKGDQVIDFDAKPEPNTLVKFINTVI